MVWPPATRERCESRRMAPPAGFRSSETISSSSILPIPIPDRSHARATSGLLAPSIPIWTTSASIACRREGIHVKKLLLTVILLTPASQAWSQAGPALLRQSLHAQLGGGGALPADVVLTGQIVDDHGNAKL